VDIVIWILTGIWSGIASLFYVITHPATVFDLSDKQNIMRIVYYGASKELFFAFFNIFVAVFIVGMFRRQLLWRVVVGLETFTNTVGRIAAWAGLIMVLQQVMVVFLQSIFRAADITLGPLGQAIDYGVAWWSDGLKLHNAIIVCLCASWTFVQGGHVRVDLFYASARYRTRKLIDMFGSLFFMIPGIVITWFYAWFFLWRHLITPPVNATDTLERTLLKATAMRWNVETTGFSPSGFNGYFLFKVLILLFCLTILVQAVTFFYRSYLEYVEGESSAGKYHDKDRIGDETAELAAEIH
jgi:TRAP-type mannitol/chloroaromatic compound transport system permease small subunit